MKLTLKEKAKLFWDRNKKDILGWLIGAGVITGVGCIAAHRAKKQEEGQKAFEEMVRLMAEQADKEKTKAAEAEEEKIKNDPANQIAGGYVRPGNDDLSNPEYPNILVNAVPIANMGELGQEVVQRLNEQWFGESGKINPDLLDLLFDPATATVDVMIDFGHEVWKGSHPEEAESQEKQSA